MTVVDQLVEGIWIALEFTNLGLAILGVVIGLLVGAMPGLGSVNGVAILLPFTFVIQKYTGSVTSPMIFLAAIYYGAMYGGAISSITLGIPGASTAVATTFDGRPMALKGRADRALVTAAVASFIGGSVANVLFTGFAPLLSSVALDFGNPEIFALMLLAFATFIGLGGDDIPKTIFSICFGLMLGADSVGGHHCSALAIGSRRRFWRPSAWRMPRRAYRSSTPSVGSAGASSFSCWPSVSTASAR